MKKNIILLCYLFAFGCAQNNHAPAPPTPVAAPSSPPPASQWHKTDTLTSGEKSFLARLSKESDVIVWATHVERYYKADSTLLYSKLLFPDGFLQEKGYVYLNWAAPASSPMHVSPTISARDKPTRAMAA